MLEYRVGDRVKAKFYKYGKHIVVGTITEIEAREGKLWVTIQVTGRYTTDPDVQWMVDNHVNVFIPMRDIISHI